MTGENAAGTSDHGRSPQSVPTPPPLPTHARPGIHPSPFCLLLFSPQKFPNPGAPHWPLSESQNNQVTKLEQKPRWRPAPSYKWQVFIWLWVAMSSGREFYQSSISLISRRHFCQEHDKQIKSSSVETYLEVPGAAANTFVYEAFISYLPC